MYAWITPGEGFTLLNFSQNVHYDLYPHCPLNQDYLRDRSEQGSECEG